MPTYYSDTPSAHDLLGRHSFAKGIAQSLLSGFKSGDDSIVIGINGKWGCGKSTLLRFIKEEINKNASDEKFIIFEFNPWLFSGQKELQTVFLNQLLVKMRDLNKKIAKGAKKAKRLTEIINPLLRVLAAIKPLSKYVYPGISLMIEDFEKFVTAFDKDKPIDELKEKVNTKIKKAEMRFFIFIDDVERLTPQETTEIFQLIKLNANFVNTYYVIAYDREIVQESLMQQYKEVGRRYLDKIVQVDFKVPEMFDEVLEDIFFEKLQLFLEENAINYHSRHFFKIWQHNDFRGYFSTLRDIYRYINALQLRLPAIHEEVFIADFLILEAIRLFDNFSYEEIYRAYKLSLIKKHSIQRILVENKEFQEKSNPFSRALITAMFSLHAKGDENAAANKEISDKRYFERYFSLSLSSVDVIGNIFNQFIYHETDRLTLLKEVFNSDKAPYFIRRLFNSWVSDSDISIEKIILAFIEFGSKYYHSFSIERYADQIFDLIEEFVERLPNKARTYKWLLNELLLEKYEFNLFIIFLQGKYYEKMNNTFQKIYGSGTSIDSVIGAEGIGAADFKSFQKIENNFQGTIETIFKKQFISSSEGTENSFFVKFLVLKYAGFFPNAYYDYLRRLIAQKNLSRLKEIIEYTIDVNQVSGKPIAINKTVLILILPNITIMKKVMLLMEEDNVNSPAPEFLQKNILSVYSYYNSLAVF